MYFDFRKNNVLFYLYTPLPRYACFAYQATSGTITKGISSPSTNGLVLTPMSNAMPNCQLLFSTQISSAKQAKALEVTNQDSRIIMRYDAKY
jgi:hypothetical protein